MKNGLLGDRDVYVYREGFYRGCTIALALLSIALIVRALRDWTRLAFPAYVFYVSPGQLLIAALIAAGAARICKKRFERFGAHRVTRAIFAFLVSDSDAASSRKQKAAASSA